MPVATRSRPTRVDARKSTLAPSGATRRISDASSVSDAPQGKSRDRDRKRRQARQESAPQTFAYYHTEGRTRETTGDHKRAIVAYTKALDERPDHIGCLLSRSHCYLQIGDLTCALIDANAVLDLDATNVKGLQQKADILYQMAEFEQALVFYHRGNKIRPEMHAFRLGIQLSQGAIDDCIGEKAQIKLDKSGDLSFFTELQQQSKDSNGKTKSKQVPAASRQNTGVQRETSTAADDQDRDGKKQRTPADADEKTMKELLRELYVDKQYLEILLNETEKSKRPCKTNEEVVELSTSCLNYLDDRASFWQKKEKSTDCDSA